MYVDSKTLNRCAKLVLDAHGLLKPCKCARHMTHGGHQVFLNECQKLLLPVFYRLVGLLERN